MSALHCRRFPFDGTATNENGIFRWLGTACGVKTEWSNPAQAPINALRVTIAGAGIHGTEANLVHRGGGVASGFCSGLNGSMTTTLLDGRTVLPTHYSLRWTNACNVPANWRLEGSTDGGTTFVLLKRHEGDESLKVAPHIGSWAIESPAVAAAGAGFSAFRLTMHKAQTNGSTCLHVCCFEVYGTIHCPTII